MEYVDTGGGGGCDPEDYYCRHPGPPPTNEPVQQPTEVPTEVPVIPSVQPTDIPIPTVPRPNPTWQAEERMNPPTETPSVEVNIIPPTESVRQQCFWQHIGGIADVYICRPAEAGLTPIPTIVQTANIIPTESIPVNTQPPAIIRQMTPEPTLGNEDNKSINIPLPSQATPIEPAKDNRPADIMQMTPEPTQVIDNEARRNAWRITVAPDIASRQITNIPDTPVPSVNPDNKETIFSHIYPSPENLPTLVAEAKLSPTEAVSQRVGQNAGQNEWGVSYIITPQPANPPADTETKYAHITPIPQPSTIIQPTNYPILVVYNLYPTPEIGSSTVYGGNTVGVGINNPAMGNSNRADIALDRELQKAAEAGTFITIVGTGGELIAVLGPGGTIATASYGASGLLGTGLAGETIKAVYQTVSGQPVSSNPELNSFYQFTQSAGRTGMIIGSIAQGGQILYESPQILDQLKQGILYNLNSSKMRLSDNIYLNPSIQYAEYDPTENPGFVTGSYLIPRGRANPPPNWDLYTWQKDAIQMAKRGDYAGAWNCMNAACSQIGYRVIQSPTVISPKTGNVIYGRADKLSGNIELGYFDNNGNLISLNDQTLTYLHEAGHAWDIGMYPGITLGQTEARQWYAVSQYNTAIGNYQQAQDQYGVAYRFSTGYYPNQTIR